jgi:hypothetical protein
MQEKKLRLTKDPNVQAITGPPAVVLDQDGTGYLCGYCGTLLLIATDGQITNAVVMCKMCGRHNEADTPASLPKMDRAPRRMLSPSARRGLSQT